MSKQVYQADCRNCGHEIRRSFNVDREYVKKNPERRVRCKECRTTNYIERPETIA